MSGGDIDALREHASTIKGLRVDYEGANSEIRSALQSSSGAAADEGLATAISAVDERVFFSLAHLPEVISVTGGIVSENAENLAAAFGEE
ncbi:hypothetical protein [Brevibacterium litoralis]|uniref:hypothetical protein n=1 Tax=Brevibacterium litoralis TaxID=3138935 RepID=UPI0032ED4A9E